jgi:hypothetical protein
MGLSRNSMRLVWGAGTDITLSQGAQAMAILKKRSHLRLIEVPEDGSRRTMQTYSQCSI